MPVFTDPGQEPILGAGEIVYPAVQGEFLIWRKMSPVAGGYALEAMFRRFHTASMPDYCLSGAYLREPSMQCFIPARSDPYP